MCVLIDEVESLTVRHAPAPHPAPTLAGRRARRQAGHNAPAPRLVCSSPGHTPLPLGSTRAPPPCAGGAQGGHLGQRALGRGARGQRAAHTARRPQALQERPRRHHLQPHRAPRPPRTRRPHTRPHTPRRSALPRRPAAHPAAHACAPRVAQGAIDAAFVDRADIKQYIGPPGLGARPATATAIATATPPPRHRRHATATATPPPRHRHRRACTVQVRHPHLVPARAAARRRGRALRGAPPAREPAPAAAAPAALLRAPPGAQRRTHRLTGRSEHRSRSKHHRHRPPPTARRPPPAAHRPPPTAHRPPGRRRDTR